MSIFDTPQFAQDYKEFENEHKAFQTFSGADIHAYIPYYDGSNVRIIKFSEIQTITYSIHRATKNIYSLGNPLPVGVVQGSRTIAGSLIMYKFDMDAMSEIFKISSNNAIMLDQLPPFNILIDVANEMGIRRYVGIYGVKIITEGLVMSILDLSTEVTCQYTAMDIEPLREYKEFEARILQSNYPTMAIDFQEIIDNETGRAQFRNNPVKQSNDILNDITNR